MINKLLIIGVGLIGGSLARALKKTGACKEIVGSARNLLQLQKAIELGVIDRYETDLDLAAQGADLIVLAVPVGATSAVLQALSRCLAPHTVVTDVGSVKGSVVEAVRRVFEEVPPNFVPGHPIAGNEKSGVEASTVDLFEGRHVILTPLSSTNAQALAKVRAMWQSTGAIVTEMAMERHDEILAATSHLPHLLAYVLVDSLASKDVNGEILRHAAGGLRDFTRIAASDPIMWHDICLANRDAIIPLLEDFRADLERLTDTLRRGDSAGILGVFNRAKALRDRFADYGLK